jgi:type II restriction enzyme
MSYSGKGQASRLSTQQEIGGGPLGIFGEEAKKHDLNIGEVSELILKALKAEYPHLTFRLRSSVAKTEINQRLNQIDPSLGKTLFVRNASIKPDGGVLEVQDQMGLWRVILVGESKHQGNDVEKIRAGIKQGKNKDSDFMAAGNAIERVHKNILEFRNLMLNENHFPYIVFFQGSNFATESIVIETPDGRKVKLEHDSGLLNRIDRVTASNYSAEINHNHCINRSIRINQRDVVLQIPTLHFQCEPWESHAMYYHMMEVALTSLDVLSNHGQINT